MISIELHHVLNTYIYFGMGSYTIASGEVVHGEITRFLNGDPTVVYFIGGFYLVMKFGVPAIALAIYKTARYDKNQTKTVMSSGAGTYFLTGLAGVILYLFNVRLGFSWCASMIDYLENIGIADNPLWVITI
ncbi:MAG: PTS transporter subunit EIIC [Carnobacterium sp.]|uniref:PTS transporter subunit EIIC n=1 Tax=Carnobacterium sp. TaxID=48221 RepID=UPI00331541A3